MKENIIDSLSKSAICSGCGVCAAICPHNNLTMQFDLMGEYKPVLTKKCTKKCGLCLAVCPWLTDGEAINQIGAQQFAQEVGIQHTPETGYYLKCYQGYCNDPIIRSKAASGGLTTSFLLRLLKDGEVDGIACVRPKDDPEKLFEFFIARNREELLSAASSAYYPVEISGVLRQIINSDGRYAVVGLPCFHFALSLAEMKIPLLKDKIKYKIGLTCGGCPSKKYTSDILKKAKVKKGDVRQVTFRDTSVFPNRLGGTKIVDYNKRLRFVNYSYINWAHVSKRYTPTACQLCDDIFSETAHIVFMDAWLPTLRKEQHGTNLVLLRDNRTVNLLKKTINDRFLCDEVLIDRLFLAHKHGVIRKKREQLNFRKNLAQKWGLSTPKGRAIAAGTLSIKESAMVTAKFYTHQQRQGRNPKVSFWRKIALCQLIDFFWWDLQLWMKDSIRRPLFNFHYRGRKTTLK